jgi:predicted GNAT family acetyltransferase
MSDPAIVDNTSLHRFELNQGRETAFLLYTRTPNSLRLIHTEVPASLQGKGVGSKLVGGVLRIAEQQGLTVIPSCPFVADYLRRHREYLPIIDENHRRMIESGT